MTTPLPGVPRETEERLKTYHALLVKWQARINLVSPDTVKDAWFRHFEDSLQILRYLSGTRLVDMGTGAGFPGLVVAISRPETQVTLIESDAKKCEFLKTVSRETRAPVKIYNERIEVVAPFPVDVITARALAPLAQLLSWVKPYADINPDLQMVFLKGESWQDEVRVSRETFNFNLEDHPSLTSPKGRVLIITDLQEKEA